MLLERIRALLRDIPALGVARRLAYKAKGAVENVYNPICFLISYDGISQVIALNPSAWKKAIQNGVDHKLVDNHPNKKFGKFVRRQYTYKQGSKEITQEIWCCLVEACYVKYVVALRPAELQKAIEYGLKVSDQHPKFRASWIKELIRKVGLFIFLW